MSEYKLDFSFQIPQWPLATLEVLLDPKGILVSSCERQDNFMLRRETSRPRVHVLTTGVVVIYFIDDAKSLFYSSSSKATRYSRISCFLYFLQCVRDMIHVMHNQFPYWTISNGSCETKVERALEYFLPLEDTLRQKFPPGFYDTAEVISGSNVLPAIKEVFEMLVPLLVADTLGG